MRRALAAAAALVLGWGCGSTGLSERPRSEVRVVGSDTMLVLNRRLAEAFMLANPGIPVSVEGGGSSAGVAALIAGEADLAAASRPLTAEEVLDLYESFDTLGVAYPVAADALSVYLHPANPVRELSMATLAGIFAGEVRDWGELGGDPGPIRVLIRPPSSGTHRFFRDHVLRSWAYRPDAEVVARTADIVAVVAADPRAIAYGGLAYGPEVVHCAVDGVAPPRSAKDSLSGYPLSRHLTLVAAAPPEGAARTFVDWCLGPQGQAVVREVGYLPLWSSSSAGGGP
jgi:phosphate transport system substrate-binding protein